MRGLKLSLCVCLLLGASVSIQACSRTAISLEGRANRKGQRLPGNHIDPVDAGFVTLDVGTQPMPKPDAGENPAIFRVTVYDGDRPQAGIDVVFQSASGDFIHHARTSVNGTVEREIESGSMLTVVVPPDEDDDAREYSVFTYSFLQAGEHIHVGKTNPPPPDGEEYVVIFLLENKPDNVDAVRLDIGCVGRFEEIVFETRVERSINRSCLSGTGKLSALFRGEVDRRGTEVWFSHVTDYELLKDAENIIVVNNWTRGEREISVNVSGVPNDASWSYLEVQLQRENQRFVANARQQERGGDFNLSLGLPRGFSDSVFYRTAYAFLGPNEFDGYCLYEGPAKADGARVSLNAEDEFLGRIYDVETAVNRDTGRPVVSWSERRSKIMPDGRFAQIRFRMGVERYRWMGILPPSLATSSNFFASFSFPEIPTSVEGFEFWENFLLRSHQVISIESGFIDGFDDLRRNFGITAFEERSNQQAVSRFSVGGDLNFND